MRELIDCHIHTGYCSHATGDAAEYVAAGRAAGLTAMLFTEHAPLPDAFDPDRHLSMADADLEPYCATVTELARQNAQGPDPLTVALGLEVDWLAEDPGHAPHSIARGRAAGAQVFLGSVHFLGIWAFDDPDDLSGWDVRGVDEVWDDYIDVWCDAAASGLFDVMAHPDLPKKFGHRPSFDVTSRFDRMAQAARAGDVLIEVSTAGLRKPVGELYPGPELLAAFGRAGVVATVGSDAHAPREVGFAIEQAYDALLGAGHVRAAFPLPGHERRYLEL